MNNEETRWCKTHPTAFWGKDQFGNWYERCSQGFRDEEECVVGEDDEEVESERD